MTMRTNNSHEHVAEITIRASRESVWEALTSPFFSRQYFHETDIESDWTRGADVTYYNQDRTTAVIGKVLVVERPSRLSFTWHVHYNPAAKQEKPSRVTYELVEVEGATRLTVIHDQFEQGSVVLPQVRGGWGDILSKLKTLLEEGGATAIS